MFTIFIVIRLENRQLKRHEIGWVIVFVENFTESSRSCIFGRESCGLSKHAYLLLETYTANVALHQVRPTLQLDDAFIMISEGATKLQMRIFGHQTEYNGSRRKQII